MHASLSKRRTQKAEADPLPRLLPGIDDKLSKRDLALDAAGYFVIFVDDCASEIVARHFQCEINSRGLACDPKTGEVLACDGPSRNDYIEFRGKSAKDLSVKILEHGLLGSDGSAIEYCTHMEHANYLGRELQKAEFALMFGYKYVQD